MCKQNTLFSPKTDKSYKSCNLVGQQLNNANQIFPDLLLEKIESNHSAPTNNEITIPSLANIQTNVIKENEI